MPKNKNDNAYESYRGSSWQRRALHIISRRSLVRDFLAAFFVNQSSVGAKGFKFMYGQARRYPGVASWCKEADVRVIHLIRGNFLKMIVSRITAKERGIYHSTKSLESIKVRIDCRKLTAQLREIGSQIEKYRGIFSYGSYLEVFYESLVANPAEETKQILSFLDIEVNEPLTSNLKKINSSPLDDLIENYEEVRSELAGSSFETFLH